MHRFHREIARRFGAAFFVTALLLSGCAMGGDPPATTSSEVTAMQQRFAEADAHYHTPPPVRATAE